MRSEPVAGVKFSQAIAGTASVGPALRAAGAADAAACAAIYDAWLDETAWMPRRHDTAAIGDFYREHVFATCLVLVAEDGAGVAGFIAVDGEGFVAALFVAAPARGRGIGGALLRAAQAARPEGLTLWCFAANAGARRFYARMGFVEAGGTAGENDEGLPDVMLTWRAAA